MPVKLTETGIAKATKDVAESGVRRELADAGCPGLRLRISPAGLRVWVLACRDRYGRMRRFAVGNYQTKGLAEARAEARALRVKVQEEKFDPILERQRDRAKGAELKDGKGTLKWLIDEYEKKRGSRLKSWAHSRLRVDRVFAALMARPLDELTQDDLQNAADGYASPNSGAFAVRTVRPALKWASAPGQRYIKPELAILTQPVSTKPRWRVLSREELKMILPILKASNRPHAKCMLLLLYTLARRDEAAGARWADVDLDNKTWTIDDPKNKQTHVVPLSRQALALLSGLKPNSAKADTLVFATSSGTALGNWDRETKSVHADSGTALWHRHDLRRTSATMLGEMGELPDIVEAALNHVSIRSALAANYNRSRYRPRVAAALQRLGDALDGIEANAAEIIQLRPEAAA